MGAVVAVSDEELVAPGIGVRLQAAQMRVETMLDAYRLSKKARDELIVEARDEHAMSLRQIERMVGVSHSTITGILAQH